MRLGVIYTEDHVYLVYADSCLIGDYWYICYLVDDGSESHIISNVFEEDVRHWRQFFSKKVVVH